MPKHDPSAPHDESVQKIINLLTFGMPDLPGWFTRLIQVEKGEASWDDFSFEERTCKGWLLPYLFQIDAMVWGRWKYWFTTLAEGKVLDGPIPQIRINGQANHAGMKMLENCIDHYRCYSTSARLPDFVDWILWGFGEGKEKPRIDEKLNEHWYKTFNLGPLIEHPHDYLGDIMADQKSGSRWSNPHAFFPTPHNVVEMMVKMVLSDGVKKTESVFDPTVGTGRFLMYASNISLNLYGTDIDRTCVNACKVNGYLYAPWLVRPAPWLNRGVETIENKDSLAPEPEERTIPRPSLMVIDNKSQMKMF